MSQPTEQQLFQQLTENLRQASSNAQDLAASRQNRQWLVVSELLNAMVQNVYDLMLSADGQAVSGKAEFLLPRREDQN